MKFPRTLWERSYARAFANPTFSKCQEEPTLHHLLISSEFALRAETLNHSQHFYQVGTPARQQGDQLLQEF